MMGTSVIRKVYHSDLSVNKIATRVMVYKGHREMSILVAPSSASEIP